MATPAPPSKLPASGGREPALRPPELAPTPVVDRVTSQRGAVGRALATLDHALASADAAAIQASAFAVSTEALVLDRLVQVAAQTGDRSIELALALVDAASDAVTARERAEAAERQARELAKATGLAEPLMATALPDPAETRRLAAEHAPVPLCDDPRVQVVAERACPLDPAQRAEARQRTAGALREIGTNWCNAIRSAHVETRLKPLVEAGGGSAVVKLLTEVSTSLITAAVVGTGVGAIAAGAHLAAKVGAATLVADAAGAVAGKALEKHTEGLAEEGTRRPDMKADPLFHQLLESGARWERALVDAVRQLPDPALTALLASLVSHTFSMAYFVDQLAPLLRGLDHLGELHVRPTFQTPGTELALVVGARGGYQVAIVRPEVALDGATFVARPTGRYEHVAWLTPALMEHALRQEPTRAVLSQTDALWVQPPASPAPAVDHLTTPTPGTHP